MKGIVFTYPVKQTGQLSKWNETNEKLLILDLD